MTKIWKIFNNCWARIHETMRQIYEKFGNVWKTFKKLGGNYEKNLKNLE